jgi:Asp-tRNA(Asn)/Glu-tRNA(Gln) amidotransferase A subunit family amidase
VSRDLSPTLIERLSAARAFNTGEPERSWVPADALTGPLPDPERSRGEARLAVEGGAYVHVEDDERVRDAQQRAAAERKLLAGMAFAVKDNIAVAGRPIGAGTAARAEAPREPSDAPVVARLKAAGGALRGTVTLHELAYGVTGENRYAGTPDNPAAPGCAPGGSSSGSAVAVAEGSADIALGTDTGGSCRIPAAFCGVVGFKPAFGTYPMAGVLPLASSLDTVGLLARNVPAAQMAHAALTGAPTTSQLPRSVGYLPSEAEAADPEIGRRLEALLASLDRLGCRVVAAEWPQGEDVFVAGTTIFFAEAAARHGHLAIDDASSLGPDIRERLLVGLDIPATDYLGALEWRTRARRRIHALVEGLDCLIGPTVPIFPPSIVAQSAIPQSRAIVSNTRLWNLTGLPAVSIPSPARPPSGVQLVAADNQRTLAYAAAVEELLAA